MLDPETLAALREAVEKSDRAAQEPPYAECDGVRFSTIDDSEIDAREGLWGHRHALLAAAERAGRAEEAVRGAADSLDALAEASEGFCWCATCRTDRRSDWCTAMAGVVSMLRKALNPKEARDEQAS